ncbi:MAG TPA: hypothetical protein VGA88_14520 [Burkholderiales bacterium]
MTEMVPTPRILLGFRLRDWLTSLALRYEMSDADHTVLADQLHHVRGMVVLSSYRSDLYDGLYSDWRRIEKAAYADGARARIEVLWLSPACAEQQSRFFA